jgi:hypothetical protein
MTPIEKLREISRLLRNAEVRERRAAWSTQKGKFEAEHEEVKRLRNEYRKAEVDWINTQTKKKEERQ